MGNGFNIIFLNGAVVELFSKLMSFCDVIDKENKLLTAVYSDLNVLQYKIGEWKICIGDVSPLPEYVGFVWEMGFWL